MSIHTWQVGIVPAADRNRANAAMAALGLGPDTFHVALVDRTGVVVAWGMGPLVLSRPDARAFAAAMDAAGFAQRRTTRSSDATMPVSRADVPTIDNRLPATDQTDLDRLAASMGLVRRPSQDP